MSGDEEEEESVWGLSRAAARFKKFGMKRKLNVDEYKEIFIRSERSAPENFSQQPSNKVVLVTKKISFDDMEEAPSGRKFKFLEVLYASENEGRPFYNVVIVTSFLLFNLNAFLILPRVAPNSAKKTPEQLWKWRNIANSLIHSILSGFGAMLNLLKTPELRNELISTYNLFSLSTLSFSVGYFIYDFIDMATHHRRTSTYELLVHHTLVVICFSLALVTKFYQGYALVSLLIEINSVFLHIRQLLVIQGWQKTNLLYRINSYFNLGTFIVFRLIILIWMICWLALNQGGLNVGAATVTYTAFAQMFFLGHSLKLFKKILRADGYINGKGMREYGETKVKEP